MTHQSASTRSPLPSPSRSRRSRTATRIAGLAVVASVVGWSGVSLAAAEPASHMIADSGAPIRVTFARGTDHGTVHGAIDDGVSDRYVLRLGAGQQLTISGLGALHVSVTAPGGRVLPGGPGDTITFSLPSSGDYVIEIMPGMGEQSAYDVTLTAPPVSHAPSGAIRVQFPAGTFGTTLHARVNGGALNRYLLRAGTGRTVTVTLSSAANNAQFSILNPDGSVLAGIQTSASVALPANGDYTVAVWSTSGNATYDIALDIR